MFIVRVYRQREGDLPHYGDAFLDADLETVKRAACARLDGAHSRDTGRDRPERARIYQMREDTPNLLVCTLTATAHGAVEVVVGAAN